MFSLSSVRSVRTLIAPRLIKRVLARAFTDDHLLQEQYYGSKLEHLYLGRSIQAIWSAMKVETLLSCKHNFWHAKITRIIPLLSLHMKEASSYPNPLLDQLTDAEISSGHDTDFAPKAFAFQLFVGEKILSSNYSVCYHAWINGAISLITDKIHFDWFLWWSRLSTPQQRERNKKCLLFSLMYCPAVLSHTSYNSLSLSPQNTIILILISAL